MSIAKLRHVFLKAIVALSLAFLCWLYARSRHQECLDDVLIPVQVTLSDNDQSRHHLEIVGTNRVLASFTGPPSRIRELRSDLQHGEVKIHSTVTIPENRQNDSSYRETIRIDPDEIPVPPGIIVSLQDGRNTVPVTIHRIVERFLPVRLDGVGEAQISQIKLEPATVLVRGPQDVLDSMRTIATRPYALPAAPDTALSNESFLRGEIGLIKEIDGRAVQCTPATVAFRFRLHPRQRTYELTDVPVSFLCPPNFPYKPTFTTPAAGKVTVRVVGPAMDDNPLVQAYVDLTQGTFEPGRNREPVKLQLPKDFQAANEGPQLVTFTLEPQ